MIRNEKRKAEASITFSTFFSNLAESRPPPPSGSLDSLGGPAASGCFMALLNRLRGTEKLCDTPLLLVDLMEGISFIGLPPSRGLLAFEPPLDGEGSPMIWWDGGGGARKGKGAKPLAQMRWNGG